MLWILDSYINYRESKWNKFEAIFLNLRKNLPVSMKYFTYLRVGIMQNQAGFKEENYANR